MLILTFALVLQPPAPGARPQPGALSTRYDVPHRNSVPGESEIHRVARAIAERARTDAAAQVSHVSVAGQGADEGELAVFVEHDVVRPWTTAGKSLEAWLADLGLAHRWSIIAKGDDDAASAEAW